MFRHKPFAVFIKGGRGTLSDKSLINGVGPEQPIVTNEHGGMQAKNDYTFHLIDAPALFELAKVMGEGAKKYAKDNWRKIPPEEHFDHLQMHLWAWMAGDRQDEHLEHALARCFMLHATAKDKQ